jgi:hypothetical protein
MAKTNSRLFRDGSNRDALDSDEGGSVQDALHRTPATTDAEARESGYTVSRDDRLWSGCSRRNEKAGLT